MTLHARLPALHHRRDDGSLQALLDVLQDQVDALGDDLDRMYADWFIETCDPRHVPLVGDLLGVRDLLLDEVPGYDARALVANTLSHRRRKGTLGVLPDLARDATGWGAHSVAAFEHVGWTQHADHVRLTPTPPDPDAPHQDPATHRRVATVDVRDRDALDLLDAPFSTTARTPSPRPADPTGGWHDLPDVPLFVYRVEAAPVGAPRNGGTRARAVPVDPIACPHRFHLHPLGAPTVLFAPDVETPPGAAPPPAHRRVPAPLRPHDLARDLDDARRRHAATGEDVWTSAHYGPDRALHLVADDDPVPPTDIVVMDLEPWRHPPAGVRVALDVQRGRVAFAPDQEPAKLESTFHRGAPARTGGGSHDRRDPRRLQGGEPDPRDDPAAFGAVYLVGPDGPHATVQGAVDTWATDGRPDAVVEVTGDATHEEDVEIPLAGSRLILQARNQQQPLLAGDITVTGSDAAGRLRLDGLMVAGTLTVHGPLDHAEVVHATLVPGGGRTPDGDPVDWTRPSLVATGEGVHVRVRDSITGPLHVPDNAHLRVEDSIVDAPAEPGPGAPLHHRLPAVAADAAGTHGAPLHAERSTFLGAVHVHAAEHGSECIFAGPLTVRRKQRGCLRFSWIGPGSTTPRRYRCQPDLALARPRRPCDPPIDEDALRRRLGPMFTSTRYGDPGYGQLSWRCADEVRAGAEDGSEVGAHASLRLTRREQSLRAWLDDYVPFGLLPTIIPAT